MNRAEQEAKYKTITIPHDYIISQFNTLPTLPQYLVFNIFRIVRPLRKKYNLTVNEVIIIDCMYVYCKLHSTSFSASNMEKYIGYFNSNKIKYYVGSLLDKGFIALSGVMHGYNRYMLTLKAIDCINDLDESYTRALDKFIIDNRIVL